MDQTHKRVPILKTSRNARVLRLHRSNDLLFMLCGHSAKCSEVHTRRRYGPNSQAHAFPERQKYMPLISKRCLFGRLRLAKLHH